MFLFKSRRIQILSALIAAYFLVFVALRAVFFLYFYGLDGDYDSNTMLYAFYLGVKFDLRLALLVVFPVFFLTLLPWGNLLNNRFSQLLVRTYLSVASFAVLFVYLLDFGYFTYLGERLDASVLRFAETPQISLQMVWESYPVLWLSLLEIVVVLFTWWGVGRVLGIADKPKLVSGKLPQLSGAMLACLFVLLGLIGRIDGIRADSIITLRWAEAYFANDQAVAAVALNPVLYFYDTYSNRGHDYDLNIVKNSYPRIMKYLGAEADLGSELNYRRDIPAGQSGDYVSLKSQPPNIVLIMLESLGANRLGAYGNPLNPTPNLDALIKKSHFFPNFFVPSSGTARTVFGKITGIPDVSFGGTTASRNPLFADQQVVMSSLTDYEKYYFLGGSANWANIRALLRNNLGAELNLFEEGSWQGPNVDVWGISDRTLFTESHEKLLQRDKSKPFIAVIQTAANHRPFTIPDDGSGFEIQEISDSEVNKHGFLGADQFNAVRLLDYNVGYYLNELVAQSDYADNTLFLLYGDHNDSSMPSPHLKQDDDLVLNKHHVPFFIYGPGLLKEGKVFQTPMSLVDMLSTAVWLAGEPYTNTTMGRIIYQVDADSSYVIVHGGDRRNRPTIGLRGKDFYLQMLYNGENVSLHDLHRDDVKTDVQEQYPEKAAEMKSLLLALFHTATYMMYHNQKIAD